MAISVFESLVKVIMPSTAARAHPPSAPSLTVNLASAPSDRERGVRDDMIAKTVATDDLQRDQAVVDRRHLTLEGHGVVGVPPHTDPPPDRLDHRVRAGTVGDVALHKTGDT